MAFSDWNDVFRYYISLGFNQHISLNKADEWQNNRDKEKAKESNQDVILSVLKDQLICLLIKELGGSFEVPCHELYQKTGKFELTIKNGVAYLESNENADKT